MSITDRLLNWNEPRNYPSWMTEEDENNFQLLRNKMGPSSTWGDKALDYLAFSSPLSLVPKTILGGAKVAQEVSPYAQTIMNMHPAVRLGKSVKDQFNLWSNNEKDLYKDYMRGPTYKDGHMVDNVNQYSSAFGEAKGANLANAPGLGRTIFDDTALQPLDYGIGAAQLLAGNAINGAYQLGQEGYKAVRDQGWKGLLSTDWLKNAKDDLVEEGRGFYQGRMGPENPTTTADLWRMGDSVDDANISKPLGQTVSELRPTVDTIVKEAQANQAKRKQAEMARQANIIAEQTRMQQRQTSTPMAAPKVTTNFSAPTAPVGYTKPAATSVSPRAQLPSRPRARATRGRSAPIMRQSRNGPPMNRFR